MLNETFFCYFQTLCILCKIDSKGTIWSKIFEILFFFMLWKLKNARHKRNGNLSFCTTTTDEIFSNLLFLPQLTHNNDKRRPYFKTVAKTFASTRKKVEQEEMAKVKVVRKFGGSWNMSFAIIFPSYLINWFFFDSEISG